MNQSAKNRVEFFVPNVTETICTNSMFLPPIAAAFPLKFANNLLLLEESNNSCETDSAFSEKKYITEFSTHRYQILPLICEQYGLVLNLRAIISEFHRSVFGLEIAVVHD
jgi:hypothetical protein